MGLLLLQKDGIIHKTLRKKDGINVNTVVSFHSRYFLKKKSTRIILHRIIIIIIFDA